MLDRLKEFINQKTTEYIPPVVPVNHSTQTPEQKIIHTFEQFSQDLISNANFPRKSHDTLNLIIKTLNEIDFQTINLPEQALIRKILEQDIPQMVELYFSLPKAHAVSFILENGKTSKDTLIEKLNDYCKKISSIWSEAVEEKTKLLLQKQKLSIAPAAKKIDFFDL